MTVEEIIKLLDLKPHPEGGFYRETYSCADSVDRSSLPSRYQCVESSKKGSADGVDRVTAEWQIGPELEKTGIKTAPAKKTNGQPSKQLPFATAIYYLLTPDTFSAMHRLKGDEVYHFYMGDAIEMLNLHPDGTSSTLRLGHDITSGALPQHMVPYGVWQGSRLIDGGSYALMGTTMAPGFDFSDFEEGSFADLHAQYPGNEDLLRKLTRR